MATEVLNEDLHFLALSKKQQESFKPLPTPYFTKRGFRLYKWTQYGLVNPKNGDISEYWLPWKSFKIGDREMPGFKELRMRYRNVDGAVGTPQKFARSRNAVTEQWNEMSAILHAELLKPVWGFVGVTGTQRAYLDEVNPTKFDNVFLIGGDCQLCLPNLTTEHIVRRG